jgi:hypothetical protein
MLTNLYAKLIDRLIPEEEPEAQDLKAIRGKDKTASESEFLNVLDAYKASLPILYPCRS